MRGRIPDALGPANGPAVSHGVAGLVLDPPEWLTGDARELFAEAASDLAKTGAVRPMDATLLALWATLTAAAIRALVTLAAEPDPGSAEAKRLSVQAMTAVDKSLKIGAEMGLSPLSRVRLGVHQLQGTSLLASLGDLEDA